MKNLYIILLIAILSLGIYSCGNSLGYDPKVTVTKIGTIGSDVPIDTSKTNKIFRVDSVNMVFKEIIRMPGMGGMPPIQEQFNWTGRAISKSIRLDTSEIDTKLWIDMELENTTSDQNYNLRKVPERIVRFNLSFAGVLINENGQTFRLQDAVKDKNWFELFVKYIPQSTYTSFNGSQIRADLVVLDNDKELGIIRLRLNIDLADRDRVTRVDKFNGTITLFYKKP